jgi:hypothetical protein
MISKNAVKDIIRNRGGYTPGDVVLVVRRGKNGHPRGLKDGVRYNVLKVEGDNLYLFDKAGTDSEPMDLKKVCWTYVLPVDELREITLKKIIGEWYK